MMVDRGKMEDIRPDQYKSVHAQWMMPQYQMKDHAIKLLAERDTAIRERNIALAEKKSALAERDMAILQRDAAFAERNTAIMERDNAIAALEYTRENGLNGSCGPGCPTCGASRGTKHSHHNRIPQPHHQHLHQLPTPQLSNDPYDHEREMHVTEAYPISIASDSPAKVRKVKRPRKDCKSQQTATPRKKVSKSAKSKRVSEAEDLNKQATFVKPLNERRGEGLKHHNEWIDQDLGLNQVTYDETTMPVPVCSCTGKYQQCYKWGNGGWQSACCTTALSMYPLPVMPNKRHARVGGRKMSGTVFTRLLSRLAADGHDLSIPVDLKDHWAKHGTNRYITIR